LPIADIPAAALRHPTRLRRPLESLTYDPLPAILSHVVSLPSPPLRCVILSLGAFGAPLPMKSAMG